MAKTMKTAISIPKEDYSLMESLRKKLKKSRSEVVAEALHAWLKKKHEAILDAQIAHGYKQHPEDNQEIETLARASLKSLDPQENWESEYKKWKNASR